MIQPPRDLSPRRCPLPQRVKWQWRSQNPNQRRSHPQFRAHRHVHGRGTGQRAQRYLQLGVAGPVGTGKSSVIAAICRHLRDEFAIGVITNDIYTDEDARFLKSKGVLPEKRIRAVETGS